MADNVITIDGKEFDFEKDLNKDQQYYINQIRSCQTKSANIKFELDQVSASQEYFTNRLIASIKSEEGVSEEAKAN
tara:strand:- start:988 stop:1215 length:228 start_codon:yes stop_codon:yes gene_type:complete